MNRIDECFQRLGKSKAFVAYLVAGDPHLEKTVELVLELEKVGADIIELGVPFSDPLADGIVNQMASQRALEAGTTIEGILSAVKAIRQRSQVPLVLFTYYNPVFCYGLKKLLSDAEQAGVDGILLVDLPPEEAEREWDEKSTLKRITLIAPTTTEERMAKLASGASGFIYYVSREGVTGMQNTVAKGVEEQLERIRKYSKLPICVGFGISNSQQAESVAKLAEGVIVGSAIVNQIAEHGSDAECLERIGAFVAPLVQAVKSV